MARSNRLAAGTGTVAAVDVGVLMLDNQLPRPRGDVGNASTFEFGIAYAPIRGSDTVAVVEHRAAGLVEAAMTAASTLTRLGARSLSTCCGFLAIFQRRLADAVDVPVATSALMQIPLVLQTLRSDQRVGVLTANGATLTAEHLAAVGVDASMLERLRITGLEHTTHFYPMICQRTDHLDIDVAENEVVAAAAAAIDADPDIGAWVLECTNLPPYAPAIRQATGRPVWDATSLIGWLRAGVTEEDWE